MPTLNIDKFANAFIPSASPSELIGSAALNAVNQYNKNHGGLWVGGKVTVTPEGLSFKPNGINIAVHNGLEVVEIPLTSIRSVKREFGWVTGIVVVNHLKGEFRFRCFGAKQVAMQLASHVTAP